MILTYTAKERKEKDKSKQTDRQRESFVEDQPEVDLITLFCCTRGFVGVVDCAGNDISNLVGSLGCADTPLVSGLLTIVAGRGAVLAPKPKPCPGELVVVAAENSGWLDPMVEDAAPNIDGLLFSGRVLAPNGIGFSLLDSNEENIGFAEINDNSKWYK